ncbi:MAG: NAD(P)/FAD-dependent oxidoreductase [Pseudomonadota bacterium]
MNNKEQKHLVIIGGGFSGVTLARKLEKKLPEDWNIFLLSKTNFITYHPLLPEVIGASILPGHVQAPVRLMLKRTRVRMVTVDSIDYESRTIHYHNNMPGELRFDQLVLAAGVQANVGMLPGLAEHTLPLKTVGDALFIRNQVIERLEQATIHPDESRRKELTTFVVLGGGFSGVETAGELEDFLKSAQRYYKNVEPEDCKIYLVHGTDRILPELPVSLSEHTLKNFTKRGIEVLLNERAEKIEEELVVLKSGKTIHGATIICTIGTTPHAFVGTEALPLERGKVVTKPDMSVDGIEGVWAMGDCALVPNAKSGQLSPPTAQFADRQAKQLAKNIVAELAGETTTPFSYKPMGMLASTGHNKAVAEIFGMKFSGLIGFMLWRGVYLLKVPTLARKTRLFLEWNWAMFFPPDIAHLGYKRSGDD